MSAAVDLGTVPNVTNQLTVEPLGRTIEVREGQTLLDACLRQGIWLPHACGHGLCGTCKITVADGDFDHGAASPFALMDFERDEGKALACCATALGDMTIEADIDIDPDARCCPVGDYTGTVAHIEALTHDIKAVWIDLDRAMDFQAGQYVNLYLDGIENPRAYSMANPPSERRRLELIIRRVAGGQGTGYVHESLRVGEEVRLSGPFGQFFVRTSQPGPTLFLAGGSGLSSPKSMILDLLERDWKSPVTLIHGVRTARDLFNQAFFEDLARRHANFTYVPALSEQAPPDWTGKTGFVHAVAAEMFGGRFAGLKAYLCGPPRMIDACLDTLMKGRLFERDIFMERFLSAADATRKVSALFKKI